MKHIYCTEYEMKNRCSFALKVNSNTHFCAHQLHVGSKYLYEKSICHKWNI